MAIFTFTSIDIVSMSESAHVEIWPQKDSVCWFSIVFIIIANCVSSCETVIHITAAINSFIQSNFCPVACWLCFCDVWTLGKQRAFAAFPHRKVVVTVGRLWHQSRAIQQKILRESQWKYTRVLLTCHWHVNSCMILFCEYYVPLPLLLSSQVTVQ